MSSSRPPSSSRYPSKRDSIRAEKEALGDHLDAVEKSVALAHVAECAGRYDEMADYMKERVEVGGGLSAEERDLLSAAYKGALEERRNALRVAASVAAEQEVAGNAVLADLAQGYRSKVEVELMRICQTVVDMLRERLVPLANEGEPKIFYMKMEADYYRYTAEFATGEMHQQAAYQAQVAYNRASAEAEKSLLITHPVRLQLALNYSVFLHEVMKRTPAARTLAKAALDSAITELHHMPEEAYSDVAHTLTLLQDNLSMWDE